MVFGPNVCRSMNNRQEYIVFDGRDSQVSLSACIILVYCYVGTQYSTHKVRNSTLEGVGCIIVVPCNISRRHKGLGKERERERERERMKDCVCVVCLCVGFLQTCATYVAPVMHNLTWKGKNINASDRCKNFKSLRKSNTREPIDLLHSRKWSSSFVHILYCITCKLIPKVTR